MIYFFGDSFIGIFNLLNNKNYIIHKYKGATAKGLGKVDNENRIHIQNVIKSKKPSCAIFNFGSVDTFFTIYHKIFIQKKIEPIADYYSESAKNYVKFIKRLNIDNVIIILPGYSPVKDKNVLGSLQNYGIISREFSIEKEYEKLFSRATRNEFVDTFNQYVKKFSRKNMQIIDINDIIATKNGEIKDEYINISCYSIHYRWEPLIEKLIEKIKIPACKINIKSLRDLDDEEKKYLKYKTGKIKNTHPPQIMNIKNYPGGRSRGRNPLVALPAVR